MATRKIRTDRLLKLADFLETVPARAFDIWLWRRSKATKPEGHTPGECGFAGCAMGWAAHEKMFRGLSIDRDNTLRFRDPVSKTVEFEFGAAAKVFAIYSEEAHELFSGSGYPTRRATPKQVATRIRKFVRDHAKAGT